MFDNPIDRNEFPTMKWNRAFLQERFGNPDAIPMSVADMDLPAPPAVIEKTHTACLSPGKTFNISGLVDAITVIPNKDHREQFHDFAHRFQTNKTNVFAMAAMQAAYTDGASWLDLVITYLQANVAYVRHLLAEQQLRVSLIEPEGTLLLWLDFRALDMDVIALHRFLGEQAGIAVAPGYWFGREGSGFARMTIGSPRTTVEKAMKQLTAAL